MLSRILAAAGISVAAATNSLCAQSPDSAALAAVPVTAPLAFGIRVGNRPRVAGLRLNYRDDGLQSVYGANVTVWEPHRDSLGGNIYGFSLGLPLSSGARIRGVAIGGLAVEATDRISGVAIAPFVVADHDIQGIAVAGLMLGGFGRTRGIVAAPVLAAIRGLTGASVSAFVASDSAVKGITVSGAMIANDLRWIQLSAIGAVSYHDILGLTIAGVAIHGDDRVSGISVAGLSVAGHKGIRGLVASAGLVYGPSVQGISLSTITVAPVSLDGIAVAGFTLATSSLRGIGAAGAMLFASRARGVVISSLVNTDDMTGLAIAPLALDVPPLGHMRGVTIAGFNNISGTQHGLALGVFNYAAQLHGLQIGLWNIAENNPRAFRRLPLVNVHLRGE